MKKIIAKSVLVGLMLIGVNAFAQSNNKFLASTSHPVTVAAQQGMIKASYMQGDLAGAPAISLIFENTGHSNVNFSWVVKNATGTVIYTSPNVSLAGGQSLNDDNKPANSNLTFVYTLNTGMLATDYKVEITIGQ